MEPINLFKLSLFTNILLKKLKCKELRTYVRVLPYLRTLDLAFVDYTTSIAFSQVNIIDDQ